MPRTFFYEKSSSIQGEGWIHLDEGERIVCGWLNHGMLDCRRFPQKEGSDNLYKIEDFRKELQLAPAGTPTMHYDDEIGPYPLYPGGKGQFVVPDDFEWYVLVRSPKGARIIFVPQGKPENPPLSWDLRAMVGANHED